jgi:Ca-activated chloride channel homolog
MLAIIVVAAGISGYAQVSTFSVTTEEVRIDALVTDSRRPVVDLRAEDFEVLDNGVKQKVEYVSFEKIPISATMVLDLSKSVTGELLDHLKDAGDVLLKGLKKDERAALITFDNAVKLRSPLATDIDRIKTVLYSMESLPYGETSLIDASYAGLMLAESNSERPLLVVFSDGLDTLSWLPADEVLDSAKHTRTVVYAVSTKQSPDTEFQRYPREKSELRSNEFLRELAKCTGGSLLELESFKDLGETFGRILEEFRRRYLITYIPQGVPARGWHTVKVRVKQHNYKVMHRPGYMQESAGKH